MVRLLIITQKVDINDDILGFFHRWIEEFAKKCEKVTVICLQLGEYNLPDNVKILSLGKEKSRFKIQDSRFKNKFKYTFRFWKYIWEERKNYDKVFVHMNPEYVVLGGIPWELMRKKIYLWYTHKSVNLWLRLAVNLADKVFTASDKSFRLKSDKVVVTGHGIDTEKFSISNFQFSNKLKTQNSKFTILTVGRITKSKNIDLLIEAGEILKKRGFDFEIKIAGGPVTGEDKIYFEKLKETVKEKKLENFISFVGPIPNKDIPEFYKKGDSCLAGGRVFINLSDTGSMDKAVLEAMASGLLVLTSNEAFKEILPGKYFVNNDARDVAERVAMFSSEEPNPELKKYVEKNHNLKNLIDKIISEIREF